MVVEGTPERVAAYVNRQAAFQRAAGEKTGVIATEEMHGQYGADVIKYIGSRDDEESIARNLFAALREFDDENVTIIYSESFSSEGLGQAIMNRLLKAAGHQVIQV
jgi:SUA5 domain.